MATHDSDKCAGDAPVGCSPRFGTGPARVHNAMRRVIRIVMPLAIFAVMLAAWIPAADSKTAKYLAPPGDSAISQYVEVVPNGAGAAPPRSDMSPQPQLSFWLPITRHNDTGPAGSHDRPAVLKSTETDPAQPAAHRWQSALEPRA